MCVHLIADRGDLGNAIALNSMLVNTARVVGPALAGLLLAVTSEAVCFALNALSFVAVIVAIAKMHWPADNASASRRDDGRGCSPVVPMGASDRALSDHLPCVALHCASVSARGE